MGSAHDRLRVGVWGNTVLEGSVRARRMGGCSRSDRAGRRGGGTAAAVERCGRPRGDAQRWRHGSAPLSTRRRHAGLLQCQRHGGHAAQGIQLRSRPRRGLRHPALQRFRQRPRQHGGRRRLAAEPNREASVHRHVHVQLRSHRPIGDWYSAPDHFLSWQQRADSGPAPRRELLRRNVSGLSLQLPGKRAALTRRWRSDDSREGALVESRREPGGHRRDVARGISHRQDVTVCR